jgi:DNA polymerase-3 subunit gamma/tau
MSALDQVIAFSGNEVRDEDVTALLGLVEPKVLSRTVRAIAQNDLPALLKIVGDLVEAGQDLHNFCRRLSGQLRNLMVLKAGISDPALLGIPESLLPDLREQAQLFSREDLLRLFDAFQKIENGMKYATQVRFQLEMGLVELAHITKLRPLEELVAEFRAITEKEAGREITASPVRASTPQGTRSASPKPDAKQASAPVAERVPGPAIPLESPRAETNETPSPVRDSRGFLLEIAAAVRREALESLLQSLKGARLQGEQVVLEPGSASEFVRRQVKENLSDIAQAAARVVGSRVTVILAEMEAQQTSNPRALRDNPSEGDLLEKAKREPVVRSFLDVFPGPVKAEKIDP